MKACLRRLCHAMAHRSMLTGQGTMQNYGPAPCMYHQQRLRQVQRQHSRRHLDRHHRHCTRRSAAQLITKVVQTAERPTAAYPGGTRPSIEERISAFDGRGIAVVSPPLTDIHLPSLRDSRHRVLLTVSCLQIHQRHVCIAALAAVPPVQSRDPPFRCALCSSTPEASATGLDANSNGVLCICRSTTW